MNLTKEHGFYIHYLMSIPFATFFSQLMVLKCLLKIDYELIFTVDFWARSSW